MFQSLRSHSLSLQILLPIFAFLPYIVFLFTDNIPEAITHNAQGWLYHNWQAGIHQKPWFYLVLGWLINVSFAYSLYWLNIRFEVIGKRTVYISFLFSLLVLLSLGFHSFHPGMLGGVFLLISLIFLFLIYHHSDTHSYLFNSGFFWGLSFIVYPPFLAMFPLFLLGARFVKSTSWRDFFLLIAGLLTPVWIWAAIAYLKGSLHFQWLSFLQWAEIRSTWPPELPGNNILWYIFLGFLPLVLMLYIKLFRVKKDVGRRVLILMSQLLWLCPITMLIFERVSVEILWVALVPMAFLFSLAAFNSKNPWISDFIFLILFVIMVIFQLNIIL